MLDNSDEDFSSSGEDKTFVLLSFANTSLWGILNERETSQVIPGASNCILRDTSTALAVEEEKTPSQDEISAALEKYIQEQTAAGKDVDLTKISPETIA